MNQLDHYNQFEQSIVEIEESCNFIPDVSTKEGYEKSKRIGLDGRKVEKAIDDKRLELKKEAMKTADEIHEAGKMLCSRILGAYKPHQEAYKERDLEAKLAKEAAAQLISDRIDLIRSAPMDCFSFNSEQLSNKINELLEVDIEAGNRTIEVGQARDSSIAKLSEMKAHAIVNEVNQAELAEQKEALEKQQAEAAKAQDIIDEANRIERKKLDEDNRLAREKQQADQAIIDEQNRAAAEELRVKQAEESAKIAERNRIEAEEKQRADEEAKRAANKAHRKSINNAALKDLSSAGFSEEDSKRVIELIAQGKISNITINY